MRSLIPFSHAAPPAPEEDHLDRDSPIHPCISKGILGKRCSPWQIHQGAVDLWPQAKDLRQHRSRAAAHVDQAAHRTPIARDLELRVGEAVPCRADEIGDAQRRCYSQAPGGAQIAQRSEVGPSGSGSWGCSSSGQEFY
jgi:hypothetical protein